MIIAAFVGGCILMLAAVEIAKNWREAALTARIAELEADLARGQAKQDRIFQSQHKKRGPHGHFMKDPDA